MMRERWQDPRMMFPDIEGEPTVDEKTILTMDIRFLEELWLPGIDHEFSSRKKDHFYWLVNISDCKDIHFSNSISATEFHIPTEHKRLRIDSAGFIYLENKISATFSCDIHFERFPFDVQVRKILDNFIG